MKKITSLNPATGEVLAEFVCTSNDEVQAIVKKAQAASIDWAKNPLHQRISVLEKALTYIREHFDEIAQLISQESGKPIGEAGGSDILPVMDNLDFCIKHAPKILATKKLKLGKWALLQRSSRIVYEPLGVIGIISPWNFPFSIPMGEVISSLAAGNAVILKPSELTPLIGEKIKEIFDEAGLPHDVLQVIQGDGESGAALVNSTVDKIVFTGSVATGKKIMAAASQRLTPVILELGGKDPMIIFEDCDFDLTVSAVVWGAFTNSGQVCASVERCFVQKSIYDRFVEAVVKKTSQLKQGNPLDPNTDLGAMASREQRAKVHQQVEQALAEGAQVLCGGKMPERSLGFFYPPTVLVNVYAGMSCFKDETFGPTLPIVSFDTEEEVIERANDCPYGLTASVWTQDRQKAERVALALESGTVTINDAVYTFAVSETPWGGVKESGIGRTHGDMGLLQLVNPKHIHENKSSLGNLWWFPYSKKRLETLKAMGEMFFNRALGKRAKGLFKLSKSALPLLKQNRVNPEHRTN